MMDRHRISSPDTEFPPPILPRQESFTSLHILTRRASEGSEALPSLARRVRMSSFGARVIVWQRSDVGPAKRQGLCPKARFGALENSLDQHRSTEPLLPELSPRPGWPTAGLRAPRLGFSARSAAIASAR